MEEQAAQDPLELAVAMQDVMLPASVPVLPGLDLAARFCMPGDAEEPIGTWLDVVVVADGRVGLVVGETVGTGLAAAAAMGQLRAIIHASLSRDGDVVGALTLADAYAAHSADSRGASVVAAVVDPARASLTYATAGHVGPIVLELDVPADGAPLAGTGGGPLGTGTPAAGPPSEVQLSPGSVVVVACSHASAALEGRAPVIASDTPIDAVTHVAASTDDGSAVLAARVRPEPLPALELRLDRRGDATHDSRAALQQWLAALDAPAMDQMALAHAMAELVANAVEHGGSAHGADPVFLRAELRPDGVVVVEVDDHGTWRIPSRDAGRGRGLAMAAGLVDWLGVHSDDTGTRARLGHRLARPVPIETAASSGLRSIAAPLDVEHRGADVVALRGDFLDDETDRVAAELLVASRGGTGDVTVDLCQVTRISSGAVRMLADLTGERDAVAASPGRLSVTTAHGSRVGRTLDVAGIVHSVG